MKRIPLYITLGCCLALASCNKTDSNREQYEPMPIQRIDIAVADYQKSATDIDSLEPGLSLYLQIMSADTLGHTEALTNLSQGRVTRLFGRDIKERFQSADSLALPLGRVAAQLASISPELKISHIYGIASPYMQSVIVSDSIVIIALNHYLGPDYGGYASMPGYVRNQKTAARIPADIAEAMVRVSHPYSPVDGTLLERMLYEGAVAQVVATATGSETDALGYSDDEMTAASQKLKDAWQAIASDQLLYTTSEADIERLVSPAPFARIGSLELPARIGRYIGLHIIQSYLRNNPGTTPASLLENGFYGQSQQRLIESKFAV